MNLAGKKIIIGITASIAAYKIPFVINLLCRMMDFTKNRLYFRRWSQQKSSRRVHYGEADCSISKLFRIVFKCPRIREKNRIAGKNVRKEMAVLPIYEMTKNGMD